MKQDYLHINKAWVRNARDGQHLVIETSLPLPPKGRASHNPLMDTLLLEIHKMKQSMPELFRAVSAVEIRETPTPRMTVH